MVTKRTGLIGYPVSHSKSPAIHQYWIRHYGLDATYELFSIAPEDLGREVTGLLDAGIHGLNVTVPHKERILDIVRNSDGLVKSIGAANTVIFDTQKNHYTCTNTDAYGFINNLIKSLENAPDYFKKIVILGAGGATRAAVVSLHNAGANNITLCNRTNARASQLAQEFGVHSAAWELRDAILEGATLLINTTSLGMQGKEPLVLSLEQLPVQAAVCDVVYAPLETPLLAAARARGNVVVDGLGMLLYQAQAAFALWHGITPEVTDELRAHILNA